MPEALANIGNKIALPLLADERERTANWNGWTPVTPLAEAESPLPFEPQGEYSAAVPEAPLQVVALIDDVPLVALVAAPAIRLASRAPPAA